jgi:hypothetical protein
MSAPATSAAAQPLPKNKSFSFRVDVAEFLPGATVHVPVDDVQNDSADLTTFSPPARRAHKQVQLLPKQIVPPSLTSAGGHLDVGTDAASVSNRPQCSLWWCPPGTSSATLVTTVYPAEMENVHVVNVPNTAWADETIMWADVTIALENCTSESLELPNSPELFWDSLKSILLSVGEGDCAPPTPVLFVFRDATVLSSVAMLEIEGGAVESETELQALHNVIDFVHILADIHDLLSAAGLDVTVVLEGWKSTVPVGSCMTRSLFLPRVNRRSAKTKRLAAARRREGQMPKHKQ